MTTPPTVLDFDIQAVAVEPPYADAWRRVGGIRLYVSRLTTPEYVHAVRGKSVLTDAKLLSSSPRGHGAVPAYN